MKKKEESHFEDIDKVVRCKHPSHNPPMHLHIPQGKRYVHICPSCGDKQILEPPQYSLTSLIQKDGKYDFIGIARDQHAKQVPIRKGCRNTQCFCTGACQKIIGWRDKTELELQQDRSKGILH